MTIETRFLYPKAPGTFTSDASGTTAPEVIGDGSLTDNSDFTSLHFWSYVNGGGGSESNWFYIPIEPFGEDIDLARVDWNSIRVICRMSFVKVTASEDDAGIRVSIQDTIADGYASGDFVADAYWRTYNQEHGAYTDYVVPFFPDPAPGGPGGGGINTLLDQPGLEAALRDDHAWVILYTTYDGLAPSTGVDSYVSEMRLAYDYEIPDPPGPDEAPLACDRVSVLPVPEGPGETQPYHPVWLKFIAPVSGRATLDTLATLPNTSDTIIFVYDNLAAAELGSGWIAANDDRNFTNPFVGTLLSECSWLITEGNTYWLQVGTYDPDSDVPTEYTITLTVKEYTDSGFTEISPQGAAVPGDFESFGAAPWAADNNPATYTRTPIGTGHPLGEATVLTGPHIPDVIDVDPTMRVRSWGEPDNPDPGYSIFGYWLNLGPTTYTFPSATDSGFSNTVAADNDLDLRGTRDEPTWNEFVAGLSKFLSTDDTELTLKLAPTGSGDLWHFRVEEVGLRVRYGAVYEGPLCVLPPAGPDTSGLCELGCGEYRLVVTDRCGARTMAEFTGDLSHLEYGRIMDDTSEAKATLALTGGTGSECCEDIGKLRTWIHSGVLYRDGKLVWGPGPVTNILEKRESALVTIRDISAWLDRRLIHADYDFADTDIVQIAVALITDAMAPDDPCEIVRNLQVLGVGQKIDYTVQAGRVYAGEALRDLARIGLDYTVVGTSIILAPTLLFGPFATLTDDHFLSDIEVEERGEEAATKWNVAGEAVVGQCGDVDPYYGLLEQVAQEDNVVDVAAANLAACNRLKASNPSPVYVNVPDAAQLSSKAPVCFEQLVPGVLINVSLTQTCRPVAVTNRMTALKVVYGDGDEKVGVTLAPVGTTADQGVARGGI